MKLLLVLSILVDFVITKPTITAVSDKRFDFPYIPHFDAQKKSLYVTNPGISLIRYDLPTKQLYEGKFTNTNFKVDFFLPTSECENCFVTSAGLNVYIVNWDGYNSNVTMVRKVTTLPGTENLTYVNTARTDPRNRLLVGTWRYDRCNPNGNSPNGSVFSIENGNAKAIIDGAQYPSGFEWNKVTSQMYYIDICALNIKAYDWSAIDGTVMNPKIIYDFRDDFPFESDIAPYLPVGMSINCDGNLLVGLFNISTVAKINPRTGKLINRITMPAETITGVVYGGKHLDTMFVTSSVRKSDFYGHKEPESSNPESGKIFMIKGLGSKGCAGRSAENV